MLSWDRGLGLLVGRAFFLVSGDSSSNTRQASPGLWHSYPMGFFSLAVSPSSRLACVLLATLSDLLSHVVSVRWPFKDLALS